MRLTRMVNLGLNTLKCGDAVAIRYLCWITSPAVEAEAQRSLTSGDVRVVRGATPVSRAKDFIYIILATVTVK
jgi:hypothetical protein